MIEEKDNNDEEGRKFYHQRRKINELNIIFIYLYIILFYIITRYPMGTK